MTHDSSARQCGCGNTYLIHLYADEDATRKELKIVLDNRANEKKFMFQCPTCKREVSFYTDKPSQPFCFFCEEGALMMPYVDLLECQDLIYYCMEKLNLTQAQLATKLKATRQVIANVLRGTANLSIDQYKALDKLYILASCAKSD